MGSAKSPARTASRIAASRGGDVALGEGLREVRAGYCGHGVIPSLSIGRRPRSAAAASYGLNILQWISAIHVMPVAISPWTLTTMSLGAPPGIAIVTSKLEWSSCSRQMSSVLPT